MKLLFVEIFKIERVGGVEQDCSCEAVESSCTASFRVLNCVTRCARLGCSSGPAQVLSQRGCCCSSGGLKVVLAFARGVEGHDGACGGEDAAQAVSQAAVCSFGGRTPAAQLAEDSCRAGARAAAQPCPTPTSALAAQGPQRSQECSRYSRCSQSGGPDSTPHVFKIFQLQTDHKISFREGGRAQAQSSWLAVARKTFTQQRHRSATEPLQQPLTACSQKQRLCATARGIRGS